MEENAARTPFCLGVLAGLRRLCARHPSRSQIPPVPFERLAKHIIDRLDLSQLPESSPLERRNCASPRLRPSAKPDSLGVLKPDQLAAFVSDLLAEEFGGRMMARFALKVVGNVGVIKPRDFSLFWLPFLERLIGILQKHRIQLSTPRYRHLFAAVLEAYLFRCVGPPPFTWFPQTRYVGCPCRICVLFEDFLRSSVSAVTVASASQLETGHVEGFLVPRAHNFRCEFAWEGGVLVIRKKNTIDVSRWRGWNEKHQQAAAQLDKFDQHALCTILGRDDHSRIFNFESAQLHRNCTPVPIEQLWEFCQQPHPSTPAADGRIVSPSTMSRPAPTPYAPRSGRAGDWGGTLPSPPATSPPAWSPPGLPRAIPGFYTFASEYKMFLRNFPHYSTLGALQDATQRRRDALGEEDRAHCGVRAVGNQGLPHTAAPSTAVPSNLHRALLPFTPAPPPQRGGYQTVSRATSSTGRPEQSNSTWQGSPLPPSTSRPRVAATQASPSPSPCILAPVSSSRLNAVSTGQGSRTKTKAEALPQATSSRAVKRKAAVVIDLTEDVIDLTGDD